MTDFASATNMPMALVMRQQQRKPQKKNNKNQKKKNNKNNKNKNQLVRRLKAPHECIVHYASALMDPVNTPQGACIPYGFPIPSQRVKVFARGNLQLGTTGVGFCAAGPQLAKDNAAVTYTLTGSVGTMTTALSSFTGLGTQSLGQLPYSDSNLNSGQNPKEGRVVSLGLRVRYAGTESGRNGTVIMVEETNHANLMVAQPTNIVANISALSQRPAPDGSWAYVFYSGPVNQTETTFANSVATVYILAAIIQGQKDDLWEWEVYEHVEYAGNAISGAVATHIDPQGYAHVVEAAKDAAITQPLAPSTSYESFLSFLQAAGSTAASVISGIPSGTLNQILSPVLRQALQTMRPTSLLLQ